MIEISTSYAIYAKGIEKSFKGKAVLKGVDLAVEKGSIFALLGSNGAGKTTLIRILTTLMKADNGEARICNYDIQREAGEARKHFSLTGQFAATDEQLTGRSNLQIIGELNHLPNIGQRSEELLTLFRLTEAADKPVASYSGGMRRRLDIAMSMMSQPEIIFLDEPTTGLDPQNRAAMWQLVQSLSDAGTTIFLTTQYLEEAEALADRVAILNEGVIVSEGTVEELKEVLPQGVIEFSFQSNQDLLATKKLFASLQPSEDLEKLSLTVITDGTIDQLTQLFKQLDQTNIQVSSFTQKQPTLEEVFYKLIGEKGA
ncbi:ATP-binding cassette domain-containing protein [Enterococcus sp. 669A]|uniref:ATP-binding cassette domain-containing protein n=1 Tax=Candidatus Enterococcus moelleringii TaxID=2815325 RepID=A0ABS3LCQ0_9ENTE|nr:ATP-binding cassette domain-containing protein [Enterococcus sp. 669A]MBO1306855.1 ATP-binding cassette domain-containing protein [Enterococcus sp. 669A]